MNSSKSQTALEMLILVAVVLAILVTLAISSQQSLSASNAKIDNDKAVIFLEELTSTAEMVRSQGEGSTRTIYLELPQDIQGIYFVGNTSIIAYFGTGKNLVVRQVPFRATGNIDPIPGGQYVTIKALANGVYMETRSKKTNTTTMPPCGDAGQIFQACELGICPAGQICSLVPPSCNFTWCATPTCACRKPTCQETFELYGDCTGTCEYGHKCKSNYYANGTLMGCSCDPIPCNGSLAEFGFCGGVCDSGKVCHDDGEGGCMCSTPCDDVWGTGLNCSGGFCPEGVCLPITAAGETVDCTCKTNCANALNPPFSNCNKGICGINTICGEKFESLGGFIPINYCECRQPTCEESWDLYGNCTGPCTNDTYLCIEDYDITGTVVGCKCYEKVPCDQAYLKYMNGARTPTQACSMGTCNLPFQLCIYEKIVDPLGQERCICYG